MRKVLAVIFAAVAGVASCNAGADTYHVQVWNAGFDADKADAPPPSADPLASFDFLTDDNGLQWSASASGLWHSYGDLLRVAGTSNPESFFSGFSTTDSYLSGLSDPLAGFLGTSFYGNGGSFFLITGIFNNTSGPTLTTIQHNAGASLYVDGASVFQDPHLVGTGSGQISNSGFSLARGTHQFSLFYIAANGNPSALNADLPNARASRVSTQAVPEPGSLALLGIALAGIGFARRRLR